MKANNIIVGIDEKLTAAEDTMHKLRFINSQAFTALLSDTFTWDKLCTLYGIVNDYIKATHEHMKELRELTDAAVWEATADKGGK